MKHAPFFLMIGIFADPGSGSVPCFHLLQRFAADMLHLRAYPFDAAGCTVIRVLGGGLKPVAAGFNLLQV